MKVAVARLIVGCVGAVCLQGSAVETNLAANAGFESHDAKGGAVSWSAGKAWRFERQGTDGTFGAVFENDDPKYYGGVSQRVSVTPGRRYSFGALVKTEKLNGKALMCLEWYGPDGKYVGGTYAPGVSGTADWTALKGMSKAIPTNAVRVVLQAYCDHETVGKAVFDDVWLREVELPLVDGLYSSRYRNAAADGRVAFKAALNLPKGAEATAVGSFAFVDLENPKAVRHLPAKIADGAASVECAVADFALGENRVEFTLSNVPGRKPEKMSIAFTRLTAERERALKVRFDEYGRTIVDGRPFFPLGMYWSAVDKSKLDVYKEGPFNCLMPYHAPNRAQMDLCAERGLKVIYNVVGRDLADGSAIRRFREHPALLVWYLNDERPISLRKELTEARRYAEAYDPDHPGWIAIWQHAEVRDYLPTFDVVGTDPYPLYRWPIGMVTEWTRDTRKGLMGLKPMWQVPQVFDKGAYPSNLKMPEICRPPTLGDMRNMAWQCLAGGAKGLVFYSFFDLFAMDKTTPFESRWGEVKRMAEEIRGYVPYFLSTEIAPAVAVDDDRAVAAAWRLDGRDLVVAVNTTRENLCVNVTVGGKVRRVTLAPVEVKFL